MKFFDLKVGPFKKKKKGVAVRVYSINREKLKEAIEGIEEYIKGLKNAMPDTK